MMHVDKTGYGLFTELEKALRNGHNRLYSARDVDEP